SNRELAGAEVEMVDLPEREMRLRDALAEALSQMRTAISEVAGEYDFILLDCPPSLSLLTLNGLCAADSVLIPMQCEYYALEGLSDLVQTIRKVRSMAKLKGLGRGLDALLSGAEDGANSEALQSIAIERLVSGKYQPRTRMDETALGELAESIKAQGIMQPILVRPIDGGRFEIIAGERRWKAAQRAGLKQIPALVRSVPDQAALALSLIENIQREDLNPLEEAQGIARLIEEFRLTHDAAAAAVGRSRSAVSNLLRLMQLAKPVQALLLADKIDMGHARALLALPAANQVSAAGRIVAQSLSVRDTERLVHALL